MADDLTYLDLGGGDRLDLGGGDRLVLERVANAGVGLEAQLTLPVSGTGEVDAQFSQEFTSQLLASADAEANSDVIASFVSGMTNTVESAANSGISVPSSHDIQNAAEISSDTDLFLTSQYDMTIVSPGNTANADVSLEAQVVLSTVLEGIANAGVDVEGVKFDIQNDMFLVSTVMPSGRKLKVKYQDRTLKVKYQDRTLKVKF